MPVTSHAKVSPSGLTRSTKCPASIKAGEGYQSTGSYAAWEGSVNHEMNEMRLLGNLEGIDFHEYWLNREVEYEGHIVTVDQTMIDASDMYCEYVVKRSNEEKGSKLLIEERLDGTEIHPDLWGTTDILILQKDKIIIIDYKAGKYPVEVEMNLQLRAYGLMALSRYSDKKSVETVIVQPRSWHKDGPIRSTTIFSDDLANWGLDWLKPKIEACFVEEPEYVAGEHCHFCPHKPDCETHKLYLTSEEHDEEKRKRTVAAINSKK